MKLVKVPSPTRLLCGGALAYWLAHIINPAFVAIAVMIVLFIPIFITDYFPDRPVEVDINRPPNQSNHSVHQPINNPADNKLRLMGKHSTKKLLTDDNESEGGDKKPTGQRVKLTK